MRESDLMIEAAKMLNSGGTQTFKMWYDMMLAMQLDIMKCQDDIVYRLQQLDYELSEIKNKFK